MGGGQGGGGGGGTPPSLQLRGGANRKREGGDGDGKRGQEIRTVKEGRLLHQHRLDGNSSCGEGVVPAVGT